MLSSAAVIPHSAAVPNPSTATTRFELRSTFASAGLAAQRGTQRLPNPGTNPAQALPGSATRASSRFVVGSILWTAFGSVLPTQTASAVMATQSAVLPTWMVATALSPAIGLCTDASPDCAGDA